ncbi:dihydrofolate reductase family protein [Nesterenkonia natronophila]|nr:dihydrofolate reductase family protein [Nesterenkonia natronophila]
MENPTPNSEDRAGTVFAFLFCSVDGYFEDAEAKLDWGVNDDEFFAWNVRQLSQIGALLLGRRTYEHFAAFWTSAEAASRMPEVATFMASVPKLVITSQAPSDQVWSGTRTSDGYDLAADIRDLINEVSGDVAIFGSSELTASLLDQGLIDELRILVHPVLLGRGRSLLSGLTERIRLDPGPVTVFTSGNVLLGYRPRAHSLGWPS